MNQAHGEGKASMKTYRIMEGVDVIVPGKPAASNVVKPEVVANAACNTYCVGQSKSFPEFAAFLCELCPHNRRKSPR